MTAGTLTSETLTKAYLARIALTNAEGPAMQAVRALNTRRDRARRRRSTRERATSGARGPLHGIPVLLDDVDRRRTACRPPAGSIALQKSMPGADAALVAKLKAAGAIILGKTNVTELSGLFDANMPEGYSSLGGQVLLPSDTDKTPAGSSAGSRGGDRRGPGGADRRPGDLDRHARSSSPRRASPASSALKPTVGLRQPRRRAAGRQVAGRARPDRADRAPTRRAALDGADRARTYAARPTDRADAARRVAVISKHDGAVPGRGHRAHGARRDDHDVKTVGTPARTRRASSTREFERDLNAYLGGTSGGAGLAAGRSSTTTPRTRSRASSTSRAS